jgi:probable addiction module antidote protein
MTKAYITHEEHLYAQLQDSAFAVAYLNAALEDEEPEVFLLALRDVVQARGGFTELARKTGLNREQLYRTLSQRGNPRFYSLDTILQSVGLHLAVQAQEKTEQSVEV